MRRGAKPAKAKVGAKSPTTRKSRKDDGSKVLDLEKRLAESLEREKSTGRALSEAREQQTATSEILQVIASSPTDVQPVLDALIESVGRLCEAADSFLLLVEGDQLRVAALHPSVEGGVISNPIQRGWVAGRAVMELRTVHVEDLANAQSEFPLGSEIAVRLGHRTALAMPLLRKGVAIGALFLRRREVRHFSDKEITLLQTFADQAVIAIENVRLFTELQAKNRALTEAHAQVTETLEQQTATSEILRVISSSPTDVQPIFDAIVESALRLCDGLYSGVYRVEGDMVHLVAHNHQSPESLGRLGRDWPMSLQGPSLICRAIRERATVHLRDTQGDLTIPESIRERSRAVDQRSFLGVPMLREGIAIGAIRVSRREPTPFSDSQIELLRTFADQAVIAIENVRLFKELAASNREIVEKSRQIEVASQHKSEFLANMSHELRTPLNAIIGFSEVLSERMFGELNEKQEEYLKDIYASGTHLLALINDILDLSKIEAGRMELELSDFDLPTAIENALMLVRERAGRRSITLRTVIDERLGQMRGDERKVRQVVLNLLSNAIKFTPADGVVSIFTGANADMAYCEVRDSGEGISAEFLPHIFEKFRQADSGSARRFAGLGLGLAITRQLVESHGGSITVHSEGRGKGAMFTVRLPRLKPSDLSVGELVRPATRGTDKPLTGLCILAVDDEQDSREYLQRLLAEQGADIVCVSSAAEALNELRADSARVNLLVSDIGMPGSTGYDLIDAVRRRLKVDARHLPAVALTAFARREDTARALDKGFQKHLAKPVEVGRLIGAIRQLTGRQQRPAQQRAQRH
jgi:signal transduction histidine kinase/ActR/RegA family two-component response regulator